MSLKVERLPIPPLALGEGPHWRRESESLYLVDIDRRKIIRYHSESETYYSIQLDVPTIGFVTPVSNSKDEFLIGAGTNLYIVKWDGVSDTPESMKILQTLEGEPNTNRINDGKCDPSGRAWFGTLWAKWKIGGIERKGSFFSYSKEKGTTKHFTDIGISNGLDWDIGKNKMYYIDSLNYTIDVLDYNVDGTIGNRRVVFDLRKNNLPFYPDGMTIDTDGNLWVALYTGSRVIQINPESGNLLAQVQIPTSKVTSVTWGGKNLDELFITSAGAGTPDCGPNAGLTFRVTGLNAHGLPMNEFKL
uniref:Regucalcin n=1 Tax=Riptortus pedestris TaxID=329032 RepID=R4WKU5_RIPPE|nr:anterior fat body protein [Riptortus pedestris]